jgi:glutaredoxin
VGIALVSYGVASAGCSGCERNHDDGTRPVSQDLPALELRDDTPDVLLTWIDEKGDHHVVQKPADVPENARENVRVVTLQYGHGEMLYVADLRTKNADGTYPVHSLPRSSWELIAQQRRSKAIAALTPFASQSAPTPAPAAPSSAQLSAIVYMASWCSACRSAETYLRSQGVTVISKDIEKDPRAQKEMNEKLHKAGYPQKGTIPVLDIRGKILVGFDQRAIKQVIQEAIRGDML